MGNIAQGTLGRRASRATLLALWAAAGALALTAAPAAATTVTFNYTGAEQTFTVPAGVFNVHVVAIGGAGGNGDLSGGAAEQVSADLPVEPGETLYLEVGGTGVAGGLGGAGGFNGGAGGGGGAAGGGGGASDVRTLPLAAGLSIDARLIVAAGGGGGGANGATSGGGAGGDAGTAGEEAEGSGNEGGGAGTESAGGAGGFGCNDAGDTGQLGSGGTGGESSEGGPGGGGGGGYYGGGGGGGGCHAGGGGGGGGFSLFPPGGSSEVVSLLTAPKIQIAYTPPPSIEIVSPVNGASYTQGQAVTAIYSCAANEGAGLVSCAGPVANGAAVDTAGLGPHTFTVNAEDTKGGKSAKSVSYTVVAPSPSTTPTVTTTTAPTTTPKAAEPPNTILGAHPPKNVKTDKAKVKVKFGFSSTVAGSTFQCKLDKAAFAPCASPKSYKVKPGRHKFSVEAVKGGVSDPTPATFSFKVTRTS